MQSCCKCLYLDIGQCLYALTSSCCRQVSNSVSRSKKNCLCSNQTIPNLLKECLDRPTIFTHSDRLCKQSQSLGKLEFRCRISPRLLPTLTCRTPWFLLALLMAACWFSFEQICTPYWIFRLPHPNESDVEKERLGFCVSNLFDSHFFSEKGFSPKFNMMLYVDVHGLSKLLSTGVLVADTVLQHPFTCIVTGWAQSRKTVWVKSF